MPASLLFLNKNTRSISLNHMTNKCVTHVLTYDNGLLLINIGGSNIVAVKHFRQR